MKPNCSEFGPAKELATQDITPFIGGQVERNSFLDGNIYVAEICRAVVDGALLRLGFSLVLNGERHPPFPRRWVRDDNKNSCVITLCEYMVADIGPGIDGGDGNRWMLLSADKRTMAILYPANNRKFDARVVSLLAAQVGELSGPPEVNGTSVA